MENDIMLHNCSSNELEPEPEPLPTVKGALGMVVFALVQRTGW